MSTTSLPVKHLVCEMRYDPSLAFYSVMDRIGLDLADNYPDWERSPLTLEIRNKKHHRRCFLSHQRAFFEAVRFPAEAPEFDRASKLFDRLHHELRFTTVRRIGIRQWLAIGSGEPYAQLVRTAGRKLQPQPEKFDQVLRGRVEDLAYQADVRTDTGWRYHLRLGPMERKQWFEVIPYEIGIFASLEDFTEYKDSLPERMFFIDLDSYQEDVPYSDLPSLMASIRNTSAEILSDLIHYLKA